MSISPDVMENSTLPIPAGERARTDLPEEEATGRPAGRARSLATNALRLGEPAAGASGRPRLLLLSVPGF